MQQLALKDLSVIELSSLVAGPFCAKLLGDMGARVIKIEEPLHGDVARSLGPFPDDTPHPEKSGLFLYVNTNKQGVTLNITDPAGYQIFKELLGNADIFVTDLSPQTAAELQLDYAALKTINPKLIFTPITPFGQSGPYANHKAHSLNVSHSGGEGYVLPGGHAHWSHREGPPIQLGGRATDYDGGLTAALGTMLAVLARENWGSGQQVDVSRQESEIALNRVSFTTFFAEDKVVTRENRFYPFGGLYLASDGEVVIRPTEDNHWTALCKVMNHPELIDDPRSSTRTRRMANGPELQDLIGKWALQHTKEEIYKLCRDAGCPVGPTADSREIMDNPQIRSRRFFQEVNHPEAGCWPYPTAPYQFSETPWSLRKPAPLLGEHNRQVYCGQIGLTPNEMEVLRTNGVI